MVHPIRSIASYVIGTATLIGIAGCSKTATSGRPPLSLAPATMSPIRTVDERFQSYNIEMLEVTGGDFWKPYSKLQSAGPQPAPTNSSIPAGMNPGMYQYRPPIDLTNLRRRKLAARWALHTCALAEPGQIQLISTTRMVVRQRGHQRGSMVCSRGSNGRASSTLPMR